MHDYFTLIMGTKDTLISFLITISFQQIGRFTECMPVMGTSIIYLSSFLKVKSFLLLIYFFVLGKWAGV